MHDVAEIGMKFDSITAVGSVHHVAEPIKAVRALRDVMSMSGRLKLALYSLHGRAISLAGAALGREMQLQPTLDGIRKLRQAIYALSSGPHSPAHAEIRRLFLGLGVPGSAFSCMRA